MRAPRNTFPSTATTSATGGEDEDKEWDGDGAASARRAAVHRSMACCKATGSTAASTRPNVDAEGRGPTGTSLCSARAAQPAIATREDFPAITAPTASNNTDCTQ